MIEKEERMVGREEIIGKRRREEEKIDQMGGDDGEEGGRGVGKRGRTEDWEEEIY